MLVGEDAERLQVDARSRLEVVAFLLLSVLQVGDGLVEVGVELIFVQRLVGLDVVGVLDDLDLDARIRSQVVVNVVQDLRVRRGGRADLQGVDVGGGGGGGAAGAGRQAQGGNGRQREGRDRAMTHSGSLFCVSMGWDEAGVASGG